MSMDITRHLGRFSISQNSIRYDPEIVKKIMGSVIILDAKFRFDTLNIDYVACSELFDEVPPHEEAPCYSIGMLASGEVTAFKVPS